MAVTTPAVSALSGVAISLRRLSKNFGKVKAVEDINLDVAAGEFFSILGPSGSGKTTVLRLTAGFEQATTGTIALAGEDVTGKAPFARHVSTVFQDYALFPHMSVLDNVAYGLRVRGVKKSVRYDQAREVLSTVQLADLADRSPNQLSGGQRQRVALARSIVVRPKVLLLDEPLGALDLKLREQMQVELKQLQRNLGITFVLVTHDQEEALTLSDRIAVLSEGKIVQLGSPEEIYENPCSEYVASFVGTSNIFDSDTSVRLLGRDGTHALRPEKITVDATGPPGSGFVNAVGVISESIYLGSGHRLHVLLADGTHLVVLKQSTGARAQKKHGERVLVSWALDDVVALT